uniref:Uncharacterized protein n=1 Tax=Arundo donax TaxID=35708 RepID=A0A0A9E6F8_ARUDO
MLDSVYNMEEVGIFYFDSVLLMLITSLRDKILSG